MLRGETGDDVDMSRRDPLPRGGAIRTGDHAVFETTRGRLRAVAVQHPFTGVSAVGLDVDAIIDACLAYEPLPRPGEAFSHTTAALLYGAPLPVHAASIRPLHVTSPEGVARARTTGVIGHETLHVAHRSLRFGLPVVSPGTVWVQLAPLISRHDLVAVGDYLVTGRRHGEATEPPLATTAMLDAAIHEFTGARGMKSARWARPMIRHGADSRPETLTRLLLIEGGLPEPVIGPPVEVSGGALVLHPDLAYLAERVLIEYEGAGHREPKRWKRDIERRELFEEAGWRVIRVTSDDLFERPEALIRRIRRALISRAPRTVDVG
jgi:hypothetical protein